MDAQPVLSSIQPTHSGQHVSRAQFDAIRKILGVECMFIVIDKTAHDCSRGCPGHFVHARSDGFSVAQLRGISFMINNAASVLKNSHKNQP